MVNKLIKEGEATMNNRQKQPIPSGEASIVVDSLNNRVVNTGNIEKLKCFCLAYSKSGCVSLQKWGGGGNPLLTITAYD